MSFETAFDALDASMSTVSDARSTLGVRMNQVIEQQSLNQSFNLQLTKTLSGLEDLDYARAIGDMNLQMVALEAAQQAYTQSQSTSLFRLFALVLVEHPFSAAHRSKSLVFRRQVSEKLGVSKR